MCLVDFGGERIIFIVRFLDAIITGKRLGDELLRICLGMTGIG